MKKVLSLFMVLLLAISLFACGNKENKEPTVPIPATPEQVTPITPTETPVIPPETPVTPSETPVIPPETPTPDVPVELVNDPNEVLDELMKKVVDRSLFDCVVLFDYVPFLSVEDAEAFVRGEKKSIKDGWHAMYLVDSAALQISPDMLPSGPENLNFFTFKDELYVTFDHEITWSIPQGEAFYRVLEDGRILKIIAFVDGRASKKTIYDSIDQMFGNTQ